MQKWADYFISKISYDSEHLISNAIRHEDTDLGITLGSPVDRLTIASDIKNGFSHITIHSGINSWTKGNKIRTFSIDGNPYLRIDGNKVKLDNLGDLPELPPLESDPIPELELIEPPTPKGLLPKESTPEPPTPKGLLPKESTSEPTPEPKEQKPTLEQLTELNDIEQQIAELEDLYQKLNSSDDPTPEQFSRVEALDKAIKKLEMKCKTKTVQRKKSSSSKSIPNVYCAKCKIKRKITNSKKSTMKNGKPILRGICSVCKSKVFRILKTKK